MSLRGFRCFSHLALDFVHSRYTSEIRDYNYPAQGDYSGLLTSQIEHMNLYNHLSIYINDSDKNNNNYYYYYWNIKQIR